MRPRTELVALRDARERAIAQLTEAFSEDALAVEELEGRMALVHRAASVVDVERVVADLVEPALATALAPWRAGAADVPQHREGIAAVFGGVERGGRWVVPRRLKVVAVFGGVALDLREAVLLPGVTDVHVVAVLGGVQLIVPPGLAVEVSGTAILGGFAHVGPAPLPLDGDAPVLRVHGRATLGGVAVETRLPGESEAHAHGRRRYGHPALGPCTDPSK